MQKVVTGPRPFRDFILSGICSLLIFLIISEPLLLHASKAIPATARLPEAPPFLEDLPGPHFERLAQFEALADMMRGRIPPLHDPWQFNQGNDASTFRPDGFALPLSGLYGLLRLLFPPAPAWNLTLWFSLWITLHVLWIWLGSITRDRWARLPATALVLFFPHRWDLLFSGHPAGFGFMWLLIFGICLDRARANPSRTRGILLGLSLLFLDWTAPVLTLPLLLQLPFFQFWPRSGKTHPTNLQYRTLLPGLSAAALLLLLFTLLRHFHNPLVSISSPHTPFRIADLWSPTGPHRSTFLLGNTPIGLAGLALLLRLLWRLRLGEYTDKRLLSQVLSLCALSAGLLLLPLALPLDPHPLFAFIPLWLAGALTLACRPPPGESHITRFPRKASMTLLAAWIALFYGRSLHTTLCILPPQNKVYHEISKLQGTTLLLPLLPANHPAASLPLWMARIEGVRMLNGFGNAAPKHYPDLLASLTPLNQGFLGGQELQKLSQMGVRHLILHENLFPPESSPFPVRETIFQLNQNPYLLPLIRDGSVLAWRILDTPAEQPHSPRIFPAVFPRIRLEAEDLTPSGGLLLEENTAGGGRYWRVDTLTETKTSAETPSHTIAPLPDRYWWVRMRGHGRLRIETVHPRAPSSFQDLSIASLHWQWLPLPLQHHGQETPHLLRLLPAEGNIDIDTLLLVGGLWPDRWPQRGLDIPASVFFHKGHTSASNSTLQFFRQNDPASTLLSGPNLPFPANQPVRLEMIFDTPTPEGTRLGEFYVLIPETSQSKSIPVISGLPSVMIWTPETNLPVEMGFRFFRHGDLTVHSFSIESIFPERGL